MTNNEILQVTQEHFEEFFYVWSGYMDRNGMGALVFIYGDDATAEEKIQLGFMTLGNLRDYLKNSSSDQRSTYRWVKQTKSIRGIPLLIVPSLDGLQRALSSFYISIS